MSTDGTRALERCLQELYLPAVRAQYAAVARQAAAETWGYPDYLRELAQRECQQRQQRRIERLLRGSKLPLEKSWPALDPKRLPAKVAQQLRGLLGGDFVAQRAKVPAFGPPGSGKTHAACAPAQGLARAGRRVPFATRALLVQDLLAARRDLTRKALRKRPGRYEALGIDDLG